MKTLLTLLLITTIYPNYSQTQPNYLIFYKPYTDIFEDNSYSIVSYKFNFETQYKNLKASDVQKDVISAVSHHDFRFLSISGYSYLYPGLEGGYQKLLDGTTEFISLDKKYEPYIKRWGFKVIVGTSDVISLNKLLLQSIAYDYAKSYNELLLQIILTSKH